MSRLQNAVQQIFEPFVDCENTPENRRILGERLDYYFEYLDKKGYSRPLDYTIAIGNNGELEVFFSKDFTEGKDF